MPGEKKLLILLLNCMYYNENISNPFQLSNSEQKYLNMFFLILHTYTFISIYIVSKLLYKTKVI